MDSTSSRLSVVARGAHARLAARSVGEPNVRRAFRPRLGFAWMAWRWPLAVLAVVAAGLLDALLFGRVAAERDTGVFYYPLFAWARSQILLGAFPLWSPHLFGGYPIFADGEVGLANPFVLAALLVPSEFGFVLLRFLFLGIAALGCYWLARGARLSRPASALAGLTFALGSFFQAQIHHENIIRTAAWLPLTCACADRALRANGARRLAWTLGGGLALGFAAVGLHAQVLAINLLALAGYGLLRWWSGPIAVARGAWWRRGLALLQVFPLMATFGVALGAVQIIPLAELSRFSPRGSSGLSFAEASAYSLTPLGLVQLIFPYFFRDTDYRQWGLWTHWESYLYVGLAPLVLAGVALARGRQRRAVVAWAIFGTLAILGALGQYTPLNVHYALGQLPGMSGFRAPGRLALVASLSLAMLAGYGLQALQSRARLPLPPPPLRPPPWSLVFLLLPLLVAAMVSGAHAWLRATPGDALVLIDSAYLTLPRDTYPLSASGVYAGLLWSTNLLNPWVAFALLHLALVFLAVALWQAPWRVVRRWPGWSPLLVGFTAADLLLFSYALHPREPFAKLTQVPAAVRALREHASSQVAPFRVLVSPVLENLAPNRLAPVGIEDANGYTSLESRWHRDYLHRVFRVDDDLLDLWNVRYVLEPARYGSLPNYKGVDFHPRQALMEAPRSTGLGRETFAVPAGYKVQEVRFVSALVGALALPQDTLVATVEFQAEDRSVLGVMELRAGRNVMDWSRDRVGPNERPRHGSVETAATVFDAEGSATPEERRLSYSSLSLDHSLSPRYVQVRSTLPEGAFVLYGTALLNTDGSSYQLFGRTKAKYREIYRDREVTLLENTAAYPRAFLVPSARRASALGASYGEMAREPFDPRELVVLAAESPALPAPPTDASSAGGQVQATRWDANGLSVTVKSATDQYLLVSNSYYPGWQARLDGLDHPILRGDMLFQALPMPAGDHTLELRFEPASHALGLAVSLGALALMATLAAISVFRLQRKRLCSDSDPALTP